MNGILGYLKLDGSPPQPGTLEAMARDMAALGGDGSTLWDAPNEPLAAMVASEKRVIALARYSMKAILMAEEEIRKPSFFDKWRGQRYELMLRSGPPNRHCLHRLFVYPDAWRLFPLPDKLSGLYYLFRLPLWFRRHYL